MPIAIFVNETGDEVKTHLFEKNKLSFGQGDCDLKLSAGEIHPLHGHLTLSGDVLILQREEEAQINVNGELLDGPREFSANDVMMVGETLIAALILPEGSDKPSVPAHLTERVMERDLVLRMGGARPPRSLNSIFNVINDEEPTQVQRAPSSLNSIYNAYQSGSDTSDAEEPLTFEPKTQVDPKPPTKVIAGGSDTPVPSNPRPADPKQPSSLDSIYNSLTPIPEELRIASTQSSDQRSRDSIASPSATSLDSKSIVSPQGGDQLLREVLSPPLQRLIEGAAIEEIHTAGADRLSCRVKGNLRSLSHEKPFDDIEHALRVNQSLSTRLSQLSEVSAIGRIGSFWVSAHRDVIGEPHLCLERLAPVVTEGVIASDLMPQLGKFMARGARFVIASPQGERRAAESVVASILQRYGQTQRFGLLGVQRHLGDDPAWLKLGASDRSLCQASSLFLDGLVVGDHPSLSGDLLFNVLSELPSTMVMINARNPEAAFHKARWRSVHKHLAAATINMVIFAKEIDGQPKLSSIHSYATGEKVYQLPRS